MIELLPVHQNDPAEGSYWGYMPLAFAAVQRDYAANGDAAAELAAFVAAAHDHDIEVWLDVVFNHTTEVDAAGPTYAFRGLSDGSYYRLRDDGSYIETTGCGNDVDAESPVVQDLVLWSLERWPISASTGSGSIWPSCSAAARRWSSGSSAWRTSVG